MVLTLQGPHQSPVTCWWDMLPPLCGVSSSQLQNLPLSSMEVPGDGRMLIGHILPGIPLCSQGPAGIPKAQPFILMPCTHLLQAFLAPLSKFSVSMACHYCVCRVGTPPSLNQRERCENLLLCSPFSEKTQNKSISVHLLPAQPREGLSSADPCLVSQGFLLYLKGGAALSWDCPPHLPVRTQSIANGKHSSLAYAENKCVDSR